MPLSQFDGIVYINLKRRPERKESLLEELTLLNIDEKKLHRIEAVDDPLNGIRGCLLSHIKALNFIEEQGWKRGLILEDDAIFIPDLKKIDREIDFFFKIFEENWDIFLLGGSYFQAFETPYENVYHITDSDRSHAYTIHPDYIARLRDCFQGAVGAIQSHVFYQLSADFAVDASWKDLQKTDRWFGPKKPLCHQSGNYSDIEHKYKKFRFD